MQIPKVSLGLQALVATTAFAAPASTSLPIEQRGLVNGLVGGITSTLDATVSTLLTDIRRAIKSKDRNGFLSAFRKLTPTKKVDNLDDAQEVVKKLGAAQPNPLEFAAQLVANDIISGSLDDIFAYANGFATGQSGSSNVNPDLPSGKSVYPQAKKCDAPYTSSESALRSAIYIPETFTYGKKPPVILVPGTGTTGYISFQGNFIPLLTNVEWADPVWLNISPFLLDDAQINAEHVAYAINYIAALTSRDVSVIAWSQGNIDTQWAFKYWPSTRDVTADHVAISADYKGTVFANAAEPLALLNTPSILQQRAESTFIQTLRSNGGDSAYVPTTSVYSSFFDEIVQPQSGTGASAYIKDARGVGATNSEPQILCKDQIGGTLYTHESLLASGLAFALAKDALTHDGPGQPSRLDLNSVCSTLLAPGLGLSDFLLTENTVLIGVLAAVTYLPKEAQEPAIKEYALAGASETCQQ